MLFFRAITALFLVLTTLNTGEMAAVREAAFSTGIDLSAGEMVSTYDDHGGFHGDGTTCTIIQFSDDALLEEIEKAAHGRLFRQMIQSISFFTAIILLMRKHRNPLCRPSKTGITC